MEPTDEDRFEDLRRQLRHRQRSACRLLLLQMGMAPLSALQRSSTTASLARAAAGAVVYPTVLFQTQHIVLIDRSDNRADPCCAHPPTLTSEE
eukprot:766041-Hanusia_phi.AAC.1